MPQIIIPEFDKTIGQGFANGAIYEVLSAMKAEIERLEDEKEDATTD